MRPRDRVRAWMKKGLLLRKEAPYPYLEKQCLLWTGSKTNDGHARTFIDSKGTYIHRWVYSVKYKIPMSELLLILHTCDRPNCIEPSHLYEGTDQDNSDDRQLRSFGYDRTKFYKCGHSKSPSNQKKKPGGYTQCKTCANAGERKAYNEGRR